MNEKEILLAFIQGDKKAFENLYSLYWKQVYNFACLYITTTEDVEEVVQDVFLKLWNAREMICVDRNFKGYLFIVTRNIIFNESKRKINERAYQETVLNVLENESFDLESEIDANDLKSYIDLLIEEMPPRRKEIFILSRKEHLSYKEIAERLSISDRTVEKQISVRA